MKSHERLRFESISPILVILLFILIVLPLIAIGSLLIFTLMGILLIAMGILVGIICLMILVSSGGNFDERIIREGGVMCPKCNKVVETLKDGMCKECWEKTFG